ncbi:MAG: TfoX/Sxy family protein [Vicinamibacterales bacterium]
MAYDPALAQRIRDLLQEPDIEERKMFGGLAFLKGGHMCCGVQGSDLMVRVPKETHEHTLREPHVRPMDFTGRSLKGFVYVGAEGTRSTAALRRWVAVGRQVVIELAVDASVAPARKRTSRAKRR